MINIKDKQQKRAFNRVPANILVHYYLGGEINFGKITNISENGMFVNTHMVLADINSEFEITIPSAHSELTVPIQVRRIEKQDNFYEGFAVELLKPSEKYSQYVQSVTSFTY